MGELDAAEAQIVEHVLETMRERTEPRGAEQPCQTLQRVNRAESFVDQRGIADPSLDCRIQTEQISRQGLDDLLRLGEELLARFVR